METDGNGTLEWPDPDLDFWPMSELSALNLSWLDHAELHGNSDAADAYDRLMPATEAKATSRGAQEASARVSLSARLDQGDPNIILSLFCESERCGITALHPRLPCKRSRQPVCKSGNTESSKTLQYENLTSFIR